MESMTRRGVRDGSASEATRHRKRTASAKQSNLVTAEIETSTRQSEVLVALLKAYSCAHVPADERGYVAMERKIKCIDKGLLGWKRILKGV